MFFCDFGNFGRTVFAAVRSTRSIGAGIKRVGIQSPALVVTMGSTVMLKDVQDGSRIRPRKGRIGFPGSVVMYREQICARRPVS